MPTILRDNCMSKLLAAAVRAAKKAAVFARFRFGRADVRYKKKDNSALTIVDQTNQAQIVFDLKKAFPASGFLGEEDGLDSVGDGLNWIIDPLDGTTNFGNGVPLYAISIGACRGREPVAGVIAVPETGDIFVAEKGRGAHCNNRMLRLASPRPLSRAYLNFELTHHPRAAALLSRFLQLHRSKVGGLRILGSQAVALALVAGGESDGFFVTHTSPWDVAAGAVIVMEAGGRASDFSGKPWNLAKNDLLAGHATRVRELVKILKPL